jgi:molecular chaperone Hsp33
MFKGRDRIQLKLDCEGPLKGFVVEANALGHISGYLKCGALKLDKSPESFDLAPLWGQGILSLTRLSEGADTPYTGQSILYYSNIALDMAHYFLNSEQLRTAFVLSIHYDRQGGTDAASGLMLQALPGAEDEVLDKVMTALGSLPSLSAAAAENKSLIEIVNNTFGQLGMELLETGEVYFHCSCSRARISEVLLMLNEEELTDMYMKGPYPVKARCSSCNSEYQFEKEDLETLIRLKTGS